MKKFMARFKKNNKGFTLVELIIVIAIIAILAAVLTPQYIQYVERSRQGVDASALSELIHNVEIEAGITESTAATTVTVTGSTGALGGTFGHLPQVEGVIGDKIDFKSSAAAKFTTYTINITKDGEVSWEAASATQVGKLQAGTATK